MSYAQVTANTITAESGLPPQSARRLDTGQWVLGLRDAPVLLQRACGWFAVTDVARPADNASTTYDRSLTLVATVPTVTWTARPKTPAELTADTATANRAAIQSSFLTFITGADTAIANMQAIIDSPAASFTNLAQALTQVTALQNQVKQTATTTQNLIHKTVSLARYVNDNLDTLNGTGL